MTIEKLLGMSAAELAAIPQAEMEKYFEPYLHITRPDRAAKLSADGHNKSRASKQPDAYDRAKQILMEKMGINLDTL